jgi:phosphohistidine phosphatase
MKILLLIRHAHSDWGGFQITDHKRPLSKTGQQEALNSGLFLKNQSWNINGFIHSDARRTTETAAIIHSVIEQPAAVIIPEPRLYASSPETIESAVIALPDSWSVAGIICHNPGISDFLRSLFPGRSLQAFSPGSMAAISMDAKRWVEFPYAEKNLLFFHHPG